MNKKLKKVQIFICINLTKKFQWKAQKSPDCLSVKTWQKIIIGKLKKIQNSFWKKNWNFYFNVGTFLDFFEILGCICCISQIWSPVFLQSSRIFACRLSKSIGYMSGPGRTPNFMLRSKRLSSNSLFNTLNLLTAWNFLFYCRKTYIPHLAHQNDLWYFLRKIFM